MRENIIAAMPRMQYASTAGRGQLTKYQPDIEAVLRQVLTERGLANALNPVEAHSSRSPSAADSTDEQLA